MTLIVYLQRSNRPDKKYMVTIGRKTIHFGSKGASDFTRHKNEVKRKAYVSRHKARENWGKSGIKTAGFWSRWLLWSKPSLTKAITYMNKKFNISIKRGKPPKRN